MKTAKPAPLGYLILIWRRLATVSLWYSALALAFILVLVATAFYQPVVVLNMVFGAPALYWLAPGEAAHMQDVHLLVKDALLLAITTSIILGSYWYHRGLDRGMTRGALAMMIALCILLIPFRWTFNNFHRIFFPQGNWQFPADSWLITTFPLWFFATVAIVWFVLALGALVFLHRKYTHKA